MATGAVVGFCPVNDFYFENTDLFAELLQKYCRKALDYIMHLGKDSLAETLNELDNYSNINIIGEDIVDRCKQYIETYIDKFNSSNDRTMLWIDAIHPIVKYGKYDGFSMLLNDNDFDSHNKCANLFIEVRYNEDNYIKNNKVFPDEIYFGVFVIIEIAVIDRAIPVTIYNSSELQN